MAQLHVILLSEKTCCSPAQMCAPAGTGYQFRGWILTETEHFLRQHCVYLIIAEFTVDKISKTPY